MILSIWKPKYKKVKRLNTIEYYEMVGFDFLNEKKNKDLIVVYKCDRCCSDETHTTRSHVFFNENYKLNDIKNQTCRSCRSSISEYEIKKSFIPFSVVSDSIKNSNYELITTEKTYNVSKNKSQLKLNIICTNGHNITATWNNWSKGKRCRICYDKDRLDNAVKNKNGWRRYKFLVWNYTEKSYKEYYNEINPLKHKRGKFFHLDHIYSIYDGFLNNISPKIIGGFKNLRIILSEENLTKGKKSHIKLNQII